MIQQDSLHTPRHTFFLPPDMWRHPYALPPYALPPDEAHHACRVLRLRKGELVRLLDGQGHEALCHIESISKPSANKPEVRLTVLEQIYHEPPETGLILATAWTKAARKSFLLEKAVELNALGIWFWQAEHSQFPVPIDTKDAWQAQLLASLKQCHNPWLPHLHTCPNGIAELVEKADAIPHKHVLLEANHKHIATLSAKHLALTGHTICVIGPEGGFAPQEIEILHNAGYTALSLGERVLRWESAAVLCLGLHYWHALHIKNNET